MTLTFGNVSGFDRAKGMMAIKPSGVGYAHLKPRDIVLGGPGRRARGGPAQPSTDAPTHLALYRAFPGIGGVTPSAHGFAGVGSDELFLGRHGVDGESGEDKLTGVADFHL